ncbi:hypothetical protein BDF19DRAFT_468973 [Syncephalis fuscata]|nr:hypothetical protein BDF19DRAFT_468973 [Syncephalis fuscata]
MKRRSSSPPRRRLRRFLSSIMCRTQSIDIDETSRRLPMYFTSLEGPLPCQTGADWLPNGSLTEHKPVVSQDINSQPLSLLPTHHNAAQAAISKDHLQMAHHGKSEPCVTTITDKYQGQQHDNDDEDTLPSASSENNLTRFVKRSLTGHRKRFSRSSKTKKNKHDMRHSVDFHTLQRQDETETDALFDSKKMVASNEKNTHSDLFNGNTRRQRSLTDTMLGKTLWRHGSLADTLRRNSTSLTKNTPAIVTDMAYGAAATTITDTNVATTSVAEEPSTLSEPDLHIPSELMSPSVPPRMLTLRLRGSRESASSSLSSSVAIVTETPPSPSPSPLVVSAEFVSNSSLHLSVPSSQRQSLRLQPPKNKSQTSLASVTSSSIESHVSSKAAPSPAGTFGQPGSHWWSRGRRSIAANSSGAPMLIVQHTHALYMRKSSFDDGCSDHHHHYHDTSCRVSISSVPGNGNKSKSGYHYSSLLAGRPVLRNERPHSIELPVSSNVAVTRELHELGQHGGRDTRIEQRRAVTSWHV